MIALDEKKVGRPLLHVPLCVTKVKSHCLFQISADVVRYGSCDIRLVVEVGLPTTSVPEEHRGRGGRRADEDGMVAAIVRQSCFCSSLQASLVFFTLLSDSDTHCQLLLLHVVGSAHAEEKGEVDDGRILMQLHSRLKLKDGWIDNDG